MHLSNQIPMKKLNEFPVKQFMGLFHESSIVIYRRHSSRFSFFHFQNDSKYEANRYVKRTLKNTLCTMLYRI